MLKHHSTEKNRISKNTLFKLGVLLLMVVFLPAVFPKRATGKKEDQVDIQEITADTFVDSILLPTIEVMAGANPTLSNLEDKLGTKAAYDEEYESYYVKKRNYLIVIESAQDGSHLSEVAIYPNFDRFLTFEEVSSVLGCWRTIHESKTSRVLFKRGKSTGVYVHLLDPPSLSASRVLSFTVRNLMSAKMK